LRLGDGVTKTSVAMGESFRGLGTDGFPDSQLVVRPRAVELRMIRQFMSSRAEESHPHPLLEPDVNVAIHPAPDVQPCFKCPVREEPELLGSNPLQPLVRPFPGALESLVFASCPSL